MLMCYKRLLHAGLNSMMLLCVASVLLVLHARCMQSCSQQLAGSCCLQRTVSEKSPASPAIPPRSVPALNGLLAAEGPLLPAPNPPARYPTRLWLTQALPQAPAQQGTLCLCLVTQAVASSRCCSVWMHVLHAHSYLLLLLLRCLNQKPMHVAGEASNEPAAPQPLPSPLPSPFAAESPYAEGPSGPPAHLLCQVRLMLMVCMRTASCLCWAGCCMLVCTPVCCSVWLAL